MSANVLYNIRYCNGFTTIEILVSIALIGILSAIAYPSYKNQVYQGRRADAQIALMTGAAFMEKYYFENGVYLTSSDSNKVWNNSQSSQGYYSMSIANSGCGASPCFKLTATASGLQAGDSECTTLTYDSYDIKSSTPAGGDCW